MHIPWSLENGGSVASRHNFADLFNWRQYSSETKREVDGVAKCADGVGVWRLVGYFTEAVSGAATITSFRGGYSL